MAIVPKELRPQNTENTLFYNVYSWEFISTSSALYLRQVYKPTYKYLR